MVNAQSYNATFPDGNDNWIEGYAGYPAKSEENYDINITWSQLPDSSGFGLSFSGNNYSKQLFLFVKKHFENLHPNTTYRIIFNMDLYTNYIQNNNENIFIKAGAMQEEPVCNDYSMVETNIKKGDIGKQGLNMNLLGNVAKKNNNDSNFEIINFQNYNNPFYVNTNDKGDLWITIGIEPQMQEMPDVYISTLRIIFRNDGMAREISNINPSRIRLYPVTAQGILLFQSDFENDIEYVSVYSSENHLMKVQDFSDKFIEKSIRTNDLPDGNYKLVFTLKDGRTVSKNILVD